MTVPYSPRADWARDDRDADLTADPADTLGGSFRRTLLAVLDREFDQVEHDEWA